MKERFLQKKFSRKTKVQLVQILGILDEYDKSGYKLTLRQLYYQLVSRDIIPNLLKEYQKLSRLLSDARLTGLVDWDMVEDRVRIPHIKPQFTDIKHLVETALYSYRKDRWKDQDYYVELWCEKDALSGVLKPITDKYHIHLLVNRGYGSTTVLYDASKRFASAEQGGKICVLLYLGDLDPSGEDMVRDISMRLYQFNVNVFVRKIGLTIEQVQLYDPPPNPAKKTDPRSKEFISKYGSSSWEVDALRPDDLNHLIKSEIQKFLDETKMKQIIQEEDAEKKLLIDATKKLTEIGVN